MATVKPDNEVLGQNVKESTIIGFSGYEWTIDQCILC